MVGRQKASYARRGALAGAAVAALLAFPGIANAAVDSSVSPTGVLSVSGQGADAITITCDTSQVPGKVKINGQDPGTGPADCDAITAIDVTGGSGDNAITLTGVTSDAFPNAEPVTIDGGQGNDTIKGSELVDTMYGGEGNDRISGDDNNVPGTRDVFEGQAGDDTLVWNGGDDDDTMNGGDGTDTIEVNGSPVAGEQFAVKPSATAGRVQFDRLGPNPPGAFNLDIGTSEKLDLRMNGGDDNFTADAGLDALGFKLQVDGGDGNDVIDGGDGADLLRGGNGDDRVIGDDNPANTRDLSYGDAGNDTLVWNGGDDDDVNDGGDGNDTIEVNGSPVAGEQFEVKPSATPGHVQFDRLGPSPTPGTFNLDIVTSERLDLRMNGGDDTVTAASGLEPLGLHLDVTGGDGNDSIDGSDSADLLSGGNGNDRITADDNPPGTQDVANGDAGDDTFVWNPGDDDDVNEGGDGNDTVEVNGATAGEKFTVKPSATAGRVQFDRVSPDPKFSIDIGTSENLHVNGGDGDDTILGSKGLAGLIASTFNGDAGNDTIKGSDGADKVSGGKGSDLIVTRDRAGDEVECNGGFDLALVDRRDRVRGCEIVIGGRLRVKHVGSSLTVHGGAAALKLRCVATAKCRGTAALLYHGKSLGKVRFNLKSGKAKTYRIELNRRGHRLVAASSKARKVVLRIDAKDNKGNGWRTSDRIKLKG